MCWSIVLHHDLIVYLCSLLPLCGVGSSYFCGMFAFPFSSFLLYINMCLNSESFSRKKIDTRISSLFRQKAIPVWRAMPVWQSLTTTSFVDSSTALSVMTVLLLMHQKWLEDQQPAPCGIYAAVLSMLYYGSNCWLILHKSICSEYSKWFETSKSRSMKVNKLSQEENSATGPGGDPDVHQIIHARIELAPQEVWLMKSLCRILILYRSGSCQSCIGLYWNVPSQVDTYSYYKWCGNASSRSLPEGLIIGLKRLPHIPTLWLSQVTVLGCCWFNWVQFASTAIMTSRFDNKEFVAEWR